MLLVRQDRQTVVHIGIAMDDTGIHTICRFSQPDLVPKR
jgi:hypothetical protein